MQSPLDPNPLLALVDDSIDADTSYVKNAKRHFERQNMSEGVRNLILAFGLFRPYLRIHSETWEKWGPDRWRIDFGNRPFTHLSVKPDPNRRAFIEVYEEDKHLQTYEMLGRPEQWQCFMKWLWDYGNDRLIHQAAIEARRKASRRRSKAQIPSDPSTTTSSQKDATQKQHPDPTLRRLLRPKSFKAQASKSKGKMKPSNLGLSSLTLADIEGEAGEDQILQAKDPNGRIATVSPNTGDSVAGVKIADGDVGMAGAE